MIKRENSIDAKNAVRAAILNHVGDFNAFLKLNGCNAKTNEKYLVTQCPPTPTRAPSTPASTEHSTQTDENFHASIEACAEFLFERGFRAKDIDNLAMMGLRADLGTVAAKSFLSNALSSAAVNAATWICSLALAPVVGPIAAITLGLAFTGYVAYKYGVHAWAAGNTVNREFDRGTRPDGSPRTRFSKVGKAESFHSAIGRETTAEFARTGIRYIVEVSLQLVIGVLGFLGTAPAAGQILSATMGPLGILIGPPTNALMNVVSQCLNGRNGNRSMGPLFGIEIGTKEGDPIRFDSRHLIRNMERLSDHASLRAAKTVFRLATSYRDKFAGAVSAEQRKGMTKSKALQLIFKFMPGPLASGAGGAIALPFGKSTASLLSVATESVSAILGFGNVLAREPVQEQAKLLRTPGPGEAAESGQTEVQKTKSCYRTTAQQINSTDYRPRSYAAEHQPRDGSRSLDQVR